MIIAKRCPPLPTRFRERFIEDGWRGIERYYGARTDVMMRWIAHCGGLDVLKAQRGAYRRACAQAAREGRLQPRPDAFCDYSPERPYKNDDQPVGMAA